MAHTTDEREPADITLGDTLFGVPDTKSLYGRKEENDQLSPMLYFCSQTKILSVHDPDWTLCTSIDVWRHGIL